MVVANHNASPRRTASPLRAKAAACAVGAQGSIAEDGAGAIICGCEVVGKGRVVVTVHCVIGVIVTIYTMRMVVGAVDGGAGGMEVVLIMITDGACTSDAC